MVGVVEVVEMVGGRRWIVCANSGSNRLRRGWSSWRDTGRRPRELMIFSLIILLDKYIN